MDSGDPNEAVRISFSAGGWLQVYHYGAAAALVESGYLEKLHKSGRKVIFCGASAGSLAASALASESYFFGEMLDFACVCGEHFRSSILNIHRMKEYLEASISRFATRKQASADVDEEELMRKISDGQLEVYTTTLPWLQTKVITTFESIDDVDEALKASCCLTPLVGMPFRLRKGGELVIDGAMRNFQPGAELENTLTISALYFTNANIGPSSLFPLWWSVYPPSEADQRWLYRLGYHDTLNYLTQHSLVDLDVASELMAAEPLEQPDTAGKDRTSKFFSHVIDLILSFFTLFLRPVALILVYWELLAMLIIHIVCLPVDAVLQVAEFLGLGRRQRCARRRAQKAYVSVRNLISPHHLAHMLGAKANSADDDIRLYESSMMYRMCQPLVFSGSDQDGGEVASTLSTSGNGSFAEASVETSGLSGRVSPETKPSVTVIEGPTQSHNGKPIRRSASNAHLGSRPPAAAFGTRD